MKYPVLIFLALFFAGCKKESRTQFQVLAGPGDISGTGPTSSRDLDVDGDGSADLRLEISMAPHSSSQVFLKCINNSISLGVELKNDSTFVHYASVIPDSTKKERVIQRKFLCDRQNPADSVFSAVTNVPHLIFHKTGEGALSQTNYKSADFTLEDYIPPTTPYDAYISGDSLFRRVNVYPGDCHQDLPWDQYSYIAIKKSDGRKGWIKLQLKSVGHTVVVAEFALVN